MFVTCTSAQGNVAIDCARILTKTIKELQESDISQHAVDALRNSKVKRVHVVGRRGHVQAAFTMKELREVRAWHRSWPRLVGQYRWASADRSNQCHHSGQPLTGSSLHPRLQVTKLEEATCVVKSEEMARGLSESSKKEIELQRARKRMDALLQEVATAAEKGPLKAKQLILRFLLAPSKINADASKPDSVGSMEFDITKLDGPAEKQNAVASGQKETIKAGMVLRSVGYKSVPVDPAVPFDSKKHVVRNAKGRVSNEDGSVVAGMYCAGWLKRGPSGIIGTNITDARETVACILEDKAAGKLATPSVADAEQGMGGLFKLLLSKGKKEQDLVRWDQWSKIDAAEKAAGATKGKPREKFTAVPEMLKVATA